jgi:hypothetical protein
VHSVVYTWLGEDMPESVKTLTDEYRYQASIALVSMATVDRPLLNGPGARLNARLVAKPRILSFLGGKDTMRI